jgi:TonB-dependent starch-binding outer membrane protein SusC
LNYNKRFDGDKHNVGLLAGVEYRSEANEGTSATTEGFPTPAFQYASSGANPIGTNGFWTGYKKAAAFFQAKYSFNTRYFITGVMRYDGSSRFCELVDFRREDFQENQIPRRAQNPWWLWRNG